MSKIPKRIPAKLNRFMIEKGIQVAYLMRCYDTGVFIRCAEYQGKKYVTARDYAKFSQSSRDWYGDHIVTL